MDRNIFLTLTVRNVPMSLSVRRAWIEIIFPPVDTSSVRVALRKESVDRNNLHCTEEVSGDTSLSVRRAWIEIA